MKHLVFLLAFATTLAGAAAPAPEITVTPTATFVSVKGDERKFQEDHWRTDDWSGGLEATLHQDFGDDTTLDLAGHGIAGDGDFGVAADWLKKEVAFFHVDWAEYRRYADLTGGFYRPFATPAFTLPGDNYLTIGQLSVEGGLLLPNAPKITLGYERQYRHGEKAQLEWGSVTEGTTTRKIYPSTKHIDEHSDTIKVGIEHDLKNVHVANLFRYEYYTSDIRRMVVNNGRTTTVNESYHHNAFFNTFRLDSHLTEQIYWSLGYLFTTLDGSAGLAVSTPPPTTAFDRNWATRVIDVGQDSHVLNANMLFGPFKGLTLYTGLQAEKTSGNGFTDALLTTGLAPTTTNRIHSSTAKTSLEELFGVRYAKIPFTTLYAEARLTQQQIDLDEFETVNDTGGFLRKTDTDIFRQDYRVGFNTSPLRAVNLAGRYRRALYENDYDSTIDTVPGYPAFITLQNFTTDEVMGKVTVRPWSFLSASLQYQLVATAIKTGHAEIPGLVPRGSRISGKYEANIYSVSATVTPLTRLYLTGLFSYYDTHTSAFDNGSPAVTSYRGDVYTIIGTAGYALDEKTDVTLECVYSRSDNFKNNAAAGLPLGLDNQRTSLIAGVSRKLTENLIARLRYGWMQYNETSNGGRNDYTAQLVSAACTLRF